MAYYKTARPDVFVFIDDALDMRTVAIMHHCDYGPSFICFTTVESAESYLDITSEVTKDMLVEFATGSGIPRALFPRVRCVSLADMRDLALAGDLAALDALPKHSLPPVLISLPALF